MQTPLYAGEFAGVWKGQHNGWEVATKAPMVPASDLEKARKVGCPQHVVYVNELIVSCAVVLQGDCNMEDPASSKCATIAGCHNN